MPRIWIYCLGWLVFGLCVAFSLPHRAEGLQLMLRDQIEQRLLAKGLSGYDVHMDGQSATLSYRDDALPRLMASGETARERMLKGVDTARGISGGLADRGTYGGLLMGPVTRVHMDDVSIDSMQARLDGAAAEATSVAQTAQAARTCTEEVTQAVASRRLQYVTGSAELTGDSQTILNDIVRTVKSCPGGLVLHVDGYTDNKGKDADNLKLSTARAETAAFALIDLGLPQAAVRAKGFGAQDPIADNTTDEGRAKNRRVDFVLQPQDNEGP